MLLDNGVHRPLGFGILDGLQRSLRAFLGLLVGILCGSLVRLGLVLAVVLHGSGFIFGLLVGVLGRALRSLVSTLGSLHCVRVARHLFAFHIPVGVRLVLSVVFTALLGVQLGCAVLRNPACAALALGNPLAFHLLRRTEGEGLGGLVLGVGNLPVQAGTPLARDDIVIVSLDDPILTAATAAGRATFGWRGICFVERLADFLHLLLVGVVVALLRLLCGNC